MRFLTALVLAVPLALAACGGDSTPSEQDAHQREDEISAKLEAELPDADFASPEGSTYYDVPGGTCGVGIVSAGAAFLESVEGDPDYIFSPDGSAAVQTIVLEGGADAACQEPVREALGW